LAERNDQAVAQALQRGQGVDAAYGLEKAGLLMASLRFWLHLGPRETFCAVMAVCPMATPQLIALPWLKNRYVLYRNFSEGTHYPTRGSILTGGRNDRVPA
jgi:hypothetical protein